MYRLYKSVLYEKDLLTALNASVGFGCLSGKSIFITGATGLIGSFLVDMFLKANSLYASDIDIYAGGRSIDRLERRFEGIQDNKLKLVEQDVSKPLKLDFHADFIIHAASNAYPASFINDPVGTILSNVSGTYSLLEYARIIKAEKFLFISSGEVYGQGDLSLESFEESYSGYVDSLASRSCYPNGKRAAETMCAAYVKQYGLYTVIARPCHCYGPNITSLDNRATAQFINDALLKNDIVLKSAGTQMRSYCYIADAASAILSILTKGKAGDAYNIATPDSQVTIAGYAKKVAEKAGVKLVFEKPDEVTLAEQTPIERQVLDSRKLELLGWKGIFDINRGIQHTLDILENVKDL